MAKSSKKTRKMTTNEALEALLGKKAAKRLRKIAKQLTGADQKGSKKKRKRKKKKAAPKKRSSQPDRPTVSSRTPVEGE
jgi:hypothetical protein